MKFYCRKVWKPKSSNCHIFSSYGKISSFRKKRWHLCDWNFHLSVTCKNDLWPPIGLITWKKLCMRFLPWRILSLDSSSIFIVRSLFLRTAFYSLLRKIANLIGTYLHKFMRWACLKVSELRIFRFCSTNLLVLLNVNGICLFRQLYWIRGKDQPPNISETTVFVTMKFTPNVKLYMKTQNH